MIKASVVHPSLLIAEPSEGGAMRVTFLGGRCPVNAHRSSVPTPMGRRQSIYNRESLLGIFRSPPIQTEPMRSGQCLLQERD